MPLSDNDLTNLERGIDAAVNAILGMAEQTIVHISMREGTARAGPVIGFVQALKENRGALVNKCLIDAIAAHPSAGDAEVTQEEGRP